MGLCIQRRTLPGPGAPATNAKVVIRNLGPLVAVEVTSGALPAGAVFDACAVQNAVAPYGRAVKRAHAWRRRTARRTSPPNSASSSRGSHTVVLTAPNQRRAGASLAAIPVRVRDVAAASRHPLQHAVSDCTER